MPAININKMMDSGIFEIADTARRFYTDDLRGYAFIISTISALNRGAKKRAKLEAEGIHVPPFLIASITSSCNLHCAGCYSRASGACSDDKATGELGADEWHNIFSQASELGVSFILLAGGEPLIRREVIDTAAAFSNIIFPIFTNGTLIDENYIDFFDQNRNMILVISIEGDASITDARRGSGVSEKIEKCLNGLKRRGILFGLSITVTKDNLQEVTEIDFVRQLKGQGCGLLFYIEYVPAEPGTEHLILSEQELSDLQLSVGSLSQDKSNSGMIILSFPGDEQAMGGCLAAGRGFFHINAHGGAEPCPFSPFSKMNLREQSLLDVIKSDFFVEIQKISSAASAIHQGGCTLFAHQQEVEEIMKL